MSIPHDHFVPSSDVVTSIVIPTIIFCVGLVVAMLIGINKCKQWELDKIVEMRRTRRCIQRITARLREKNFKTIQRARRMRKKAHTSKTRPTDIGTGVVRAPPAYSHNNNYGTGISPPPTYQDAVLEQLYHECLPPKRRRSSAGKHSLK
uniref:Uncharacterized protein n=1 Tax=Panagrolaimus superbus TaxID=310955 RepID=A0A914YJV6_9BILA